MSHLGILLACDHYPQVKPFDETLDRQLSSWLQLLGHDIQRVTAFDAHLGQLPATTSACGLWIVSGTPLAWSPCCRDREGALCQFLKGVAASGLPIFALHRGEHVLHKALASPFEAPPETPAHVRAIRNPFRSFQMSDRLFSHDPATRTIREETRPQSLSLRGYFPGWMTAA